MQYLDCVRNIHAPGKDFIDLEISNLEIAWSGSSRAGAGHQPSPRAVSCLCHCNCPLANKESECHLCAVLQPTPSSGPKCEPHSLGQEQAAYSCCFPYPARLEAWLQRHWVSPAGSLLPLHHRSPVSPGYPQLSSSRSGAKRLLLPSQCSVSEVCLHLRIGKASLFFPTGCSCFEN